MHKGENVIIIECYRFNLSKIIITNTNIFQCTTESIMYITIMNQILLSLHGFLNQV